MLYFFDKWDELKEKLINKTVVLFLDFDGTLTPIVDTPNRANLSCETKEILEKLVKKENCKLIIISGRALQDLKEKIRIKDIVYVGNHGLEIEGPKIKFESKIPMHFKDCLNEIKLALKNKLSNIKGILIEDKGLSISLHYRMVSDSDLELMEKIFKEVIQSYVIKNKIKICLGKKVFEIRPPASWDKGKISLWLLAREKFIIRDSDIEPVYIGDDITDEDAFSVLKNNEFTIFVGKQKESSAKYYLKNTEEVKGFLNILIKCLN